jgi:hypothetical protein
MVTAELVHFLRPIWSFTLLFDRPEDAQHHTETRQSQTDQVIIPAPADPSYSKAPPPPARTILPLRRESLPRRRERLVYESLAPDHRAVREIPHPAAKHRRHPQIRQHRPVIFPLQRLLSIPLRPATPSSRPALRASSNSFATPATNTSVWIAKSRFNSNSPEIPSSGIGGTSSGI